MSVYYTYIVGLAQRLAPNTGTPLKVLDYGCGAGQIVLLALERGFDAYGVDLFYEGGDSSSAAKKTGLWETRIFSLRDDNFIPMDDASFDVVLANQVFEHIDDFSIPLREIDRVLKPGGLFINIFPSDVVWREGHIGIPFSHWLPRNSRVRYYYTLALRTLGAGYFKNSAPPRRWTEQKLAWIDAWTFYKPLADITRQFGQYFSIRFYEADYLIYRFERHPQLRKFAGLARLRFLKPFLAFLSNRLACHVFVLAKPTRRSEEKVRGTD